MSEKVIPFPKKSLPPEEFEVLSEWKIIKRADGSYFACYTGEEMPYGMNARDMLLCATEAIDGLMKTIEDINESLEGG